MTLGMKFSHSRYIAGMTQRELASELGISHTYISKIENDKLEVLPSDDFLRRAEYAMSLDHGVLFEASNKIDKSKLSDLDCQSSTISRVLRKLSSGKVTDNQWAEILEILTMEKES